MATCVDFILSPPLSLPPYQALDTLCLRQTGLSDLSAPQVGQLMRQAQALRSLDLGNNLGLGRQTADAIALALPACPRLAALELELNEGLSGGGIGGIAWALVEMRGATATVMTSGRR